MTDVTRLEEESATSDTAASRIAVVGHHTWFSNHFPERWMTDPGIKCLDVNETDYRFLIEAVNFRPGLTLFYRPELYPSRLVEAIPGQKIAFLSEPLPHYEGGQFLHSSETDLRLAVYSKMQWAAYDRIIYYDYTKAAAVRSLGWPVDDFSPLPIDTSIFRPANRVRPIDVCFIGKPTLHRFTQTDFMRTAPFRFVWIAHGVSGRGLAKLFQRSKIVLNIHADNVPAIEPRIYLAAACGCCVLTEPLSGAPVVMADRVVEYEGNLRLEHITQALDWFAQNTRIWQVSDVHLSLSVRRLISRVRRRGCYATGTSQQSSISS